MCDPASHVTWAAARIDEGDLRPSHPVILVARQKDFRGLVASPTRRPGEKADTVKRQTEITVDQDTWDG